MQLNNNAHRQELPNQTLLERISNIVRYNDFIKYLMQKKEHEIIIKIMRDDWPCEK